MSTLIISDRTKEALSLVNELAEQNAKICNILGEMWGNEQADSFLSTFCSKWGVIEDFVYEQIVIPTIRDNVDL